MKTSLIIHGTCGKDEYFSDEFPSLSNSHWFPWLQKQLLIRGVFAQTPEMPEAYKPQYALWKKEFERFDVDEETLLFGYSCGGGFLLRWLTKNKVRAQKLVLVAPWLDPKRRKTKDFFDFVIDKEMTARIGEIHLFVSEDDEWEILESLRIIKESLPDIRIHSFADRGHFTFEDTGAGEFPELLSVLD